MLLRQRYRDEETERCSPTLSESRGRSGHNQVRKSKQLHFQLDTEPKHIHKMGCMDWNGTKVRRKFYWIDNTPVEGSYSIWAGGEPNNSGGSENCVQMYGNDPKGKTWNDFSCEVGVNDAPVIVCQRARAM